MRLIKALIILLLIGSVSGFIGTTNTYKRIYVDKPFKNITYTWSSSSISGAYLCASAGNVFGNGSTGYIYCFSKSGSTKYLRVATTVSPYGEISYVTLTVETDVGGDTHSISVEPDSPYLVVATTSKILLYDRAGSIMDEIDIQSRFGSWVKLAWCSLDDDTTDYVYCLLVGDYLIKAAKIRVENESDIYYMYVDETDTFNVTRICGTYQVFSTIYTYPAVYYRMDDHHHIVTPVRCYSSGYNSDINMVEFDFDYMEHSTYYLDSGSGFVGISQAPGHSINGNVILYTKTVLCSSSWFADRIARLYYEGYFYTYNPGCIYVSTVTDDKYAARKYTTPAKGYIFDFGTMNYVIKNLTCNPTADSLGAFYFSNNYTLFGDCIINLDTGGGYSVPTGLKSIACIDTKHDNVFVCYEKDSGIHSIVVSYVTTTTTTTTTSTTTSTTLGTTSTTSATTSTTSAATSTTSASTSTTKPGSTTTTKPNIPPNYEVNKIGRLNTSGMTGFALIQQRISGYQDVISALLFMMIIAFFISVVRTLI